MTEQNDSSTPPRRIGWKGGVAGLLALGFAFYTISTADGDEPTTPDHGIVRHEAWGACQDAVKKRLDNPATADFAILTTEDVERPDGGMDFSGSLTADNVFGVEQQLIFSCEVEHDGTATADVQRAR